MSNTIDATDRLIDELQNAVKTEPITVNGHNFVTRPVFDIPDQPLPARLAVHSLSAIVEYVNSAMDGEEPFLVVVETPALAAVYGALNEDEKRPCFLQSQAIACNFGFGSYMGIESFIIALVAQFADTDDSEKLIELCGTLDDSSVVTVQDDGVTQTVQAKVGISRRGNVTVPKRVSLRPYRTFRDVDVQPESDFVFRLKRKEGELPQAALFEADGGLWQHSAIEKCKSFLALGIPKDKAVIIG